MPYADDPRDIEIIIDVGKASRQLVVTIRVQKSHCVGYELTEMYY